MLPRCSLTGVEDVCHNGEPRPTFAHELSLWRAGLSLVTGLDEVGRGPLAGPVVAGAAVFEPFFTAPWLSDVRDSKLLPEPARVRLDGLIRRDALAIGVGAASALDVDRLGIVAASLRATEAALAELALHPHALLLDAVLLRDQPVPQVAIIDGDALSISIASAAIVAKVARDKMMARAGEMYPGYGFGRNRGYGTAEHLSALRRLGPSPIHRMTFAPVRAVASRGDMP